MKYIFGLLFLALLALFEASILPFFPIFGVQLNLLLVSILAVQFLGFFEEANYGAFLGGVLLDLLTGGLFGLSSLTLLLLNGLAALVQRFVAGSFPVLLILTFALSVVFRAVLVVPVFNLSALCKGAFLDVVVMVVVYPLLRYVLKTVFGKRELRVGVS